MRRVIAALVVVGLAVGVLLLWPRDGEDDPPDTQAAATTPTTTSTTPATSTSAGSPVSSVGGGHVVKTVEEAEQILRELWFGWFEGIYNQDEDRIREVVVLEETVETARERFGRMPFTQPPSLGGILLNNTEILRGDAECLAAWADLDVSAFRPDASGTSGVYVVRRSDAQWKLLSVWPERNDLWEGDCDSQLS